MTVSRTGYWSLAAAVVCFLILLNVVKVQDRIARAFGYTGSVPMFALDRMVSGYTPEQASQVMTAYGESGRKAYEILLLTVDLVFPLLYGSFLFLSIRAVSAKAAIPMRWTNRLAAIGFVATCCDWLENVVFLDLIRTYPKQSFAIVRAASFFTIAKFTASGISVAILAVLGGHIFLRTRTQNAGTRA